MSAVSAPSKMLGGLAADPNSGHGAVIDAGRIAPSAERRSAIRLRSQISP